MTEDLEIFHQFSKCKETDFMANRSTNIQILLLLLFFLQIAERMLILI